MNRVEFVSISGLAPGIDLDDIMMGVSVCRNPHLANVFYRLQLIEAYGTGMRKIMSAYAGMKEQPTVEKSTNAFKIVLPNRNAEPLLMPSSQEEIILKLAADKEGVTRANVEKVLGVSGSTATRILHRMEKSGSLIQTGSARNTKYRLP